MKKIKSALLSVLISTMFLINAAASDALPVVSSIEKQISPPDILTMLDGAKVTNASEWSERQNEIRSILEYYMYGPWRDGAGETLTYSVNGESMNISVETEGKTAGFNALVTKPDGKAPDGGWPVFVVFGGMGQPQEYALSKGYAVISLNPNDIADDGVTRGGEFYKLYPYGSEWQEQSGVLMAWSWGASKILDALEQGAGSELGISTVHTIVTGVSRYGKAAAVAGAFDERFAVTMPVCSGFGGLTMGRYKSNNLTYNLLPDFENDPKKDSVGDLSAWKSTGGTEGLQGLQGSGWFNEIYKGFSSYSQVPFDQHFLSALCASEGRYLFMVSGINSDMWNSPPGLWYNYEEVRPAFELLGLEDNLAIQLHLNLHGIEIEDLIKLIAYTDYHWFGKSFDNSEFPSPWNTILSDFTLDDLKTCVFASAENAASYEEGKPNPESAESAGNPETAVSVEIMLGGNPVPVTVTRNSGGDALITEYDDGKGFVFKYGPDLQYSQTYARFTLKLPPELKIADFESVSFNCQTNANYWGKKMALIAAPKSTGLPSEFEYDYNSGAITPSEVIPLSTNNFFPPTTMDETPLSMMIDKSAAEKLNENELEFSIYIHMEHLDGDAEYMISDISFNPLPGIVIEIPDGYYEDSSEEVQTAEIIESETTDSGVNDSEPTEPTQADAPSESGINPVIIIATAVAAIAIVFLIFRFVRNKKN